jgi:regulator of nonsense transcripts 2
MKQSLAAENRDANLKDIETLSLEKYVEEIAGAAAEGLVRCKTDKDVWSAVEVCFCKTEIFCYYNILQTISALHRRFPSAFTPLFVGHLHGLLAPPTRTPGTALAPDLKEKEDSARVARQRPCLRIASELAMVGVITDVPGRSGGEWIMKVLKDLVGYLLLYEAFIHLYQLSNDPGLTSLPLLTTFLKSFRASYLVDRPNGKEPSPELSAMPTPSEARNGQGTELIEKEVKDRFTRMCHGYFEKVSKKLVNEYNVSTAWFYLRHRKQSSSVYKIKTGETMKLIFGLARYSKIDSKPMRK